MDSRINKLTKEQEAQLSVYRDKWLSIGLDCTPFDLSIARPIVDNIYEKLLKKSRPKNIIIMDNPRDTWLAVCMLNQVGNQVRDQVWNQVENQVVNQVRDQVGDQVRDQVRNQVGDQVWNQVENQVWNQVRDQVWNQVGDQVSSFIWLYLDGNFMASYFSFYDYIFSNLVEKKNNLWDIYKDTSKLSLIYPLDDICILCQKPKKISLVKGVLHNDREAAIQYGGDWNIYCLNRVKVPDWLVLQRDIEIDPGKITEITNADVRREFVRKVGYERLYHKLGGEILDQKEILISNGVDMFLHNYEVLRLKGVDWTVLKMINPSLSSEDNEVYHVEGLPPDCMTVEAAIQFRKPEAMKAIPVKEDGEDYFQHGDRVIWPIGAKSLKMYPKILT